ncbi:MAG: GNAT family N-acetyltransferase [Burkholderiales bacterium]|nr:GNAT family N-acetyltransferase [Burkholderiales bacterium]
MMKSVMVPADFIVPERLESGRFVLRPITIHDAVKDYDAVMTSIDHIAGVFGPDARWPTRKLTLEQDLIDLAWHQKEFQIRSSFTYTVVAPDESAVLGCVYLLPSLKQDADCTVYFWVRASESATDLEASLDRAVRKWLRERWPFRKPVFPGRDINWETWSGMK